MSEQKATPSIKLRLAEETDIPFIFNSWLQSFRKSNFAKPLTNSSYYTDHHRVIEQCIKRSTVLMAVDSEDPNNFYGYICAENIEGFLCVHFVYIKHTFRNMGIATTLLNAFERTQMGLYTHFTYPMEKLALKWNLMYQPYILYRKD